MSILFYDTCSLLTAQREAFVSQEPFCISNITLNELEGIKTSATKDEETKYKARKVLHLLLENEDKYEVILYNPEYSIRTSEFLLPGTSDSKIIATAYCYCEDNADKDCRFVTEDLNCLMLAKSIGLKADFYRQKEENEYTGFIEEVCSEDFLSDFYSKILPDNINYFELLDNQYLILDDEKGKVVDKYRWYNGSYHQVQYRKAESRMFGKVGPKDGDVYQQLAFDSMENNQITVMRGSAGTGKSMLGLAYLFQELERGRIDKIVMFVNPVAVKDSCKFGFLPGDLESKILGSQIGNFLSSKLGGIEWVYRLIEDGKLQFVALADSRGFDTNGLNCAVYCTESQNMNIEHMKLLLSRIGEDTKVIIEGDNIWQTDLSSYEGANNGLRRLCEVFRGEDYFGTVTLQNCYRSRVATKAMEM